MDDKSISRSTIFRDKMRMEAQEKKYNNAVINAQLHPLLPTKYSYKKRAELREFEAELLKSGGKEEYKKIIESIEK